MMDHEKFQSGHGYGSGEKGSDAHEKQSNKQFGDNPLPKSGGGWKAAGEVQPEEDPEGDLMTASEAKRVTKKKKQDDVLHS